MALFPCTTARYGNRRTDAPVFISRTQKGKILLLQMVLLNSIRVHYDKLFKMGLYVLQATDVEEYKQEMKALREERVIEK